MHYRHNHLTKVVLRLDHEPIAALSSLADTATRPAFSDRIAETFPHVTGQPTATLRINIGPTGSGMSPQATGTQWFHRKAETGTSVIVIDPAFTAIEYGKDDYEHFPTFRTEVAMVLNALRDLYNVPMFKRIGLRYINEIVMAAGNPLAWDGLISQELITAIKAAKPADSDMVRSMHQLHVRRNDCDMLFNYGLHNPDFPNSLARRAFVLDYDCARSGVESGDALTAIDQLNKFCESMFESSVGNDLREEMGVLND